MAYTPKQKRWIAALSGLPIAQWEAQETSRAEILEDVHKEIEAVKDRLSEGFYYELEGQKKEILFGLMERRGKSLASVREDGNAMQEVSLQYDDLSEVETISQEDLVELIHAQDEMNALADKMKQAQAEDGSLLFSDEDIMKELYRPLVQSRVMSELQVPDQYSEVHNVFNQSAELYNKRLEEFSATRGPNDALKEKLGKSRKMVEHGAELASSLAEIFGAEAAAPIITAVALGATAGLKVTEHVLDKAWKKGFDTAADSVGEIVGMFVSPELGAMVKGGISSSKELVNAASLAHQGKYAEALEELGNAVSSALSVTDPKNEMGLKKLGTQLKFGFTQASNAVKLHDAAKADDGMAIVHILGDVAKSSTSFALEHYKTPEPKEGALTPEQKEKNKHLDDLSKVISGSIDASVATADIGKGVYDKDLDAVRKGGKDLLDAGADIAEGSLGDKAQNVISKARSGAKVVGHVANTAQAIHEGDTDKALEEVANTARASVDVAAEFKGLTPKEQTRIKQGIDLGEGIVQTGTSYVEGDLQGVIEGVSKTAKAGVRLSDLDGEDQERAVLGIDMAEGVSKGVHAVATGNKKDALKATKKVLDTAVDIAAHEEVIGEKDQEIAKSHIEAGSGLLEAELARREGDREGIVEGLSKTANSEVRATLQTTENEENSAATKKALKVDLLDETAQASLKRSLSFTEATPKALEQAKSNLEEMEKEGLRQELLQDERAYTHMLEMSIGGIDPETDPLAQKAMAEMYDIDRMIQQMERDRVILQAAESVFDSAAAIGGELLPALKVLKAGKKFIKNVVAAANRAIQLNKFLDSLNTAKTAMSAYAPAIEKRVRDTRVQLADKTIEAILECAHIVGATLSMTPLSPVGKTVELAATGAHAAKGISDIIFSEREKQQAWSAYQAALKDPGNRKLKMKALSVNPTLAKYALAYGATQAGDPIAKEVMRKCGINDRTLAAPETNVKKVVKYMELYFSDDQIVLREVLIPKPWMSGASVSLSSSSWLKVMVAARTNTNPALKVGGDEQVIRTFLALEAAAFSHTDTPSKEEALSYKEDIERTKAALVGFHPLNTDNAPHEQVQTTITSYIKLLENELKTLNSCVLADE